MKKSLFLIALGCINFFNMLNADCEGIGNAFVYNLTPEPVVVKFNGTQATIPALQKQEFVLGVTSDSSTFGSKVRYFSAAVLVGVKGSQFWHELGDRTHCAGGVSTLTFYILRREPNMYQVKGQARGEGMNQGWKGPDCNSTDHRNCKLCDACCNDPECKGQYLISIKRPTIETKTIVMRGGLEKTMDVYIHDGHGEAPISPAYTRDYK